MLKKVDALVRIIHRVDPGTLSFDDLCRLYGEANWYVHLNAKLIGEAIRKELPL